MLKNIRVLLIEDNPHDAEIVGRLLKRVQNIKFNITCADNLKKGLSYIGKKFFDVILLDLMLPNGKGMYVFDSVHIKCKDIPIVIVSGYEDHAIEAVKNGAQDYLVKPFKIEQLVTSINYAIARKKAEAECHEDYKILLSIFDSMEEMIYISDPETYEIIYMNDSIKKTFGCSISQKCHTIFRTSEFPCTDCHNDKIFGNNFGKNFTYEIKIGNKWYKSTIRAFKWPDGRLLRYTISIDISESRKKQEQLSKFLEEKINEWDNRIKKSSIRHEKQTQRLKKITFEME